MASQSQPIDSLPEFLQEQLADFLETYANSFEQGERIRCDDLVARYPELRPYVERMIVDVEALCTIKADALFPSLQDRDSASMQRGTRLGEFEIIEELGRGGMGVVYLAKQESLHRNVALKVLPLAAVLDPNQITRFHTEAQAAASLHHANIVPVYSVGCERGIHYYSMQYIDGHSLEGILQSMRSGRTFADSVNEKTSPPVTEQTYKASRSGGGDSTQVTMRSRNYIRTAVEKATQTARALHFAHVRGIVHRDIKPSNLLIDRQGNLWVTDFGLARIQDGLSVTTDGNIVGTARYMSPEQAQGKSHLVDHRTDIYSLGITLYEMLTLTYAFDGPDRWQLMAAIQNSTPRPPRSISPAIPVDLETIVLKSIAQAKEDRYDSAADMADDLHRFLNGQPIEARRPSMLDRAGKWAVRRKKIVAASLAAMTVVTTLAILASAIVIQQRDRAERFSKSAQLVVDRFGSQFADRLEGIPGTDALRLEMLSETANYYDQFIDYAQHDSSLRWDAALAHYRLGAIQERMGKVSLAVQAYQDAIQSFNSMIAAKKTTSGERILVAACLRDLASLQGRSGERLSAQANFQRALELLDVPEDHSKQDLKAIVEQAKIRSDASLFFARQGNLEQAHQLLDQSISELESSTVDSSEFVKQQLAICLNNKASLLVDVDLVQAQTLLEKANLLQLRLFAMSSAMLTAHTDLAVTQCNLASALARRGDDRNAEKYYQASIALLSKVAERFPSHVRVQVELAACHNNFAQFLAKTDQVERSEQHFVIAEEKLSRTLDEFTEYPNVIDFLCGVQHNQGLLFEQTHQPDKARDAYQRALQSTKGKTVSLPTQQIIKSVSVALERMEANSKAASDIGASPPASSPDNSSPTRPLPVKTQADSSGAQLVLGGDEEALP